MTAPKTAIGSFRTYLFDFDGTLVDSMPTFISAMLRILEENRIPYGEDIVKIITPLGLIGTADYYRNTLGLDIPRDQLVALMKEYMQDAYFHTIPANYNGSIRYCSYCIINLDEWLGLINDRLNPLEQDITRNNVDILQWDGAVATSTTGKTYGIESFTDYSIYF